MRYQWIPCHLAMALTAFAPASAGPQLWTVRGGRATMTLDPDHLATLGLAVTAVRSTADRPASPALAFVAAEGLDVAFHAVDGSFRAFNGGTIEIPIHGGLTFQARNPESGDPLEPAFLYDFVLEIDLAREDAIRIRTAEPLCPVPLEVRSVGVHLHADRGVLALPIGDLVITRAWAERLGQPSLAGQWVGAFDLSLDAELVRGEAALPAEPAQDPGGDVLDVLLGELYGLTSQGRIGTFPSGQSGLSAATTSCNNGNVNVPWNAPMEETHPTIGLALFRIKDGVIEQLGQNWMKHGWFALASNQCHLGCGGGGGTFLPVGCSDTYSAANNGERFFLGPRREVNPHLAEWEACGSYFDATPADCQRDYFGIAENDVDHRLEVFDEDLGDTTWTYYYEGCYYVADDDVPDNNIGWRECTMSWTGGTWSFDTIPFGSVPTLGPVVELVGGQQTTQQVAAGDGSVVLAVVPTDLGGGQWHYEYALYNRDSDRGVRSLSIPIHGVNVTNVGFRDIDKDAGNDWTAVNDGSTITWSMVDALPDPPPASENWLHFQTLFNFRFDADAPPSPTYAGAGIFKPGAGTVVYITTSGPAEGATSVVASTPAAELALALGANPFTRGADLAFSLPRQGRARLAVLDVSGRTVQVLLDEDAPSGRSATTWNGRDATGSRVASGVYFFRLDTQEGTRTVKGTFVR
jgi:hypothetical protein